MRTPKSHQRPRNTRMGRVVQCSFFGRKRSPRTPAVRFARKSHSSCENQANRPTRRNNTKDETSTTTKANNAARYLVGCITSLSQRHLIAERRSSGSQQLIRREAAPSPWQCIPGSISSTKVDRCCPRLSTRSDQPHRVDQLLLVCDRRSSVLCPRVGLNHDLWKRTYVQASNGDPPVARPGVMRTGNGPARAMSPRGGMDSGCDCAPFNGANWIVAGPPRTLIG